MEGLTLKLNSNPLATWCEELTHLTRPWCWERLKAGGGGDDRGWDGWMASLTQWTWVWKNSGNWWWTGEAWGAAVHGISKTRTQLSDWTELTYEFTHIHIYILKIKAKRIYFLNFLQLLISILFCLFRQICPLYDFGISIHFIIGQIYSFFPLTKTNIYLITLCC